MKNILAVANKEFWGYFYNPIGYVFVGLMLLLSGWVFWGDVFVSVNADIRPLLQTLAYLLSVFVPAITMGWVADEKKNGTWEVLTAAPIKISQILWGKLLAGVGFLVTALLLTLPSLISLTYLGLKDMGTVFSGYLGVLMLGITYMAIGLWVSSLTKFSAVAFLGTTVVLVLNSLMGQDMVLSRLPPAAVNIVQQLSLGDRVVQFYSGQISLTTTVYLLSVIVLFTWLANKANEKNL